MLLRLRIGMFPIICRTTLAYPNTADQTSRLEYSAANFTMASSVGSVFVSPSLVGAALLAVLSSMALSSWCASAVCAFGSDCAGVGSGSLCVEQVASECAGVGSGSLCVEQVAGGGWPLFEASAFCSVGLRTDFPNL